MLESRPKVLGQYGHAQVPIETRLDPLTFDIINRMANDAGLSRMEFARRLLEQTARESIAERLPNLKSNLYEKYRIVRITDGVEPRT